MNVIWPEKFDAQNELKRMKDYYKTLHQSDFPSWEDYMLERIQRGLAAGYTFDECYTHWLEYFSETLHRLSDELHGQTTEPASAQ